jgi:dihydrolipoamide dehydrogenase
MGGPFDLVILGAGSGGYACALRAAQLGFSVVLVEQDKVGGTCLHRGCIPTKAMLHAAEVADSVRLGSEIGIHAAIDKVDLAAVVSYADSVVTRMYKGVSGLLNAGGSPSYRARVG